MSELNRAIEMLAKPVYPRKNRKPPAHAIIAGMKPEHRATLEGWLFDRNMGYPQVIKLCKKDFGVDLHKGVLSRYYKKRVHERAIERIMDSARRGREVKKALRENPLETFNEVIDLIGRMVFEVSLRASASEELPDVGPLGEILELLIKMREEAREEAIFLLERERWEFDVARICHAHFGELQAIAEDAALDDDAKLEAIRRRIFGKAAGEIPETTEVKAVAIAAGEVGEQQLES
jgi:hypothetical protein